MCALASSSTMVPLSPNGATMTATDTDRQDAWTRQAPSLHGHIPNWPDEKVRPLLEAFEELILEQRIFREVFGII